MRCGLDVGVHADCSLIASGTAASFQVGRCTGGILMLAAGGGVDLYGHMDMSVGRADAR